MLFRLCAIFLLAALPLAAQKSDTIWKGRTADGTDVVWSIYDISVSAGAKRLYSLSD